MSQSIPVAVGPPRIRLSRQRRSGGLLSFVLSVKRSEWLQLICVTYVALWAISPPLMISREHRAAAAAAAALWVVVEVVRRPQTFLRPSRGLQAAVVFVVYSGATILLFDGPRGLISQIQLYICFFFLLFFESYRHGRLGQLRFVFWLVLCVLPVWALTTMAAYEGLPGASRLLAKSGEIQSELLAQGVGGYGLVYTLVLALPFLLPLVRSGSARGVLARSVLVVNVVLAYVLTIRAGFFIALCLLAIGTLMALFIGRAWQTTVVAWVGSAGIACLLAATILSSSSGGTVMGMFEGTHYEEKVRDIVVSIHGDEPVGTVYDRSERYIRSLRTFLENPLFGVRGVTGTGSHSAVLDRFARFGVLFGFLFAYAMLFVPLGMALEMRGTPAFGMAAAMATVTTLFVLLNNAMAATGLVVYLMFPVAAGYLQVPSERAALRLKARQLGNRRPPGRLRR